MLVRQTADPLTFLEVDHSIDLTLMGAFEYHKTTPNWASRHEGLVARREDESDRTTLDGIALGILAVSLFLSRLQRIEGP